MADLRDLARDLHRGLQAMQQLQTAYDHDMWDISDPSFDKVRHIHIHISITVGKLAKLVESADHSSHNHRAVDMDAIAVGLPPILADLLMHSAQLANLVGADL